MAASVSSHLLHLLQEGTAHFPVRWMSSVPHLQVTACSTLTIKRTIAAGGKLSAHLFSKVEPAATVAIKVSFSAYVAGCRKSFTRWYCAGKHCENLSEGEWRNSGFGLRLVENAVAGREYSFAFELKLLETRGMKV